MAAHTGHGIGTQQAADLIVAEAREERERSDESDSVRSNNGQDCPNSIPVDFLW